LRLNGRNWTEDANNQFENVPKLNAMIKQRVFTLILIGTIAVLLTLIIAKSVTHNHFRNNAARWSEKSVDGSNLIDLTGLKNLETNILLIRMNSTKQIQSENIISDLNVEPDKILEKSNLRKIRRHKGHTVIVSDDAAISARIWMVLSQLGFRDVYILTEV